MRIIQAKLAGRRFGVKSKVIPQECSCKGAANGPNRTFRPWMHLFVPGIKAKPPGDSPARPAVGRFGDW